MMKNWFKKILIPSGEKTTVTAYNSWLVRWYGWDLCRISYGGNAYCSPMAEIFPSEEEANKFAQQLRESFRLLKQTGEGCKVTVEANQSTTLTI